MSSMGVFSDLLIETTVCEFVGCGDWLASVADSSSARALFDCKLGRAFRRQSPQAELRHRIDRFFLRKFFGAEDETENEDEDEDEGGLINGEGRLLVWALKRKEKWSFLLPWRTPRTRLFLFHQRNEASVKLLHLLNVGGHAKRFHRALTDSLKSYMVYAASKELLEALICAHTEEWCLTNWMSRDWPPLHLGSENWDSCTCSDDPRLSTACLCLRVRHQCDRARKAWGLRGYTFTCYDNAWGKPHDYKHEETRDYPETPACLRQAAAAATIRKPQGPDKDYGFYAPFKRTSGLIYATVCSEKFKSELDQPIGMFTTEGILALGSANLRSFPLARTL